MTVYVVTKEEGDYYTYTLMVAHFSKREDAEDFIFSAREINEQFQSWCQNNVNDEWLFFSERERPAILDRVLRGNTNKSYLPIFYADTFSIEEREVF